MKKRVLIAMLCAATVLTTFAACGKSASDPAAISTEEATPAKVDQPEEEGMNQQIANPWMMYDNLEDASAYAGFTLVAPTTMEGFETTIQVMNHEIIEVSFEASAKGVEGSYCIRKGLGNLDISGDYNEYSEENTVDVNGISVTMKGDNGLVSLATWADGDYVYCIGASGISVDEMTALIQQVQ